MIIHLNGWPGAGKKTIGSILAKNLGARFVHNHLLHDVAIIAAGLGSPDRWTVYEKVRAAAYEALLNQPTTEVLVLTNGLCKTAPRELKAWRHVVELAVSRRVPLIPVILEVEAEENCRRIQSEERKGKKMTDPEGLRSMLKVDTLQHPDVPETFTLDVTHLEPAKAAEQIQAHLERVRPDLRPASEQHLVLR